MELLFRKYFWTVNLLFLALAAFLVARTANVFTEGMIATPPDPTAGGPSVPARPAYAMPARLSGETLSRVTGIPLPKEPEIKEPVASKPVEDLNSAPVHTSMHVRLLGTTVANRPEWSWAVVEDTQAHTNNTYMVDDKIQSATVLQILDDCTDIAHTPEPKGCVVVLNGGHREYIDDKEGNGPMVANLPPPAVAVNDAPPPSNVGGNGIKALDENNYEVQRSEVNNALNNLNDLAMQARIVPAFKDGVATGFKLFSIRPDSLYAKIGIQNGDVIRRINGFEINSPDKALEAYSKLKEASRIELEVERNGSTVRKTYNVR